MGEEGVKKKQQGGRGVKGTTDCKGGGNGKGKEGKQQWEQDEDKSKGQEGLYYFAGRRWSLVEAIRRWTMFQPSPAHAVAISSLLGSSALVRGRGLRKRARAGSLKGGAWPDGEAKKVNG